MISLFEQDACLHGGNGSSLTHILRPILPDLEAVRGHLAASHIGRAKQQLQSIADSDFKASLRQLADRIAACACDVLVR